MKHSDQIDQLAAALCKARLEFPDVEKLHEADTGKYKYDYADLADILAAVQPVLAKHGIWLFQDVKSTPERPDVITVVSRMDHVSGQWRESSEFSMTVVAGHLAGPQAVGSCESYARRYQILPFLGIQPRGEDDDGSSASGVNADTSAKRKALPACPKCGKTASVIVGKAEYGGGLLCWQKKDGCGNAWGTPEHPLKSKDDLPAQLAALPPGKPKVSDAYKALAHQLELIGCKSADEANAVLRWVGTDKTVAELKANSDAIVEQIVKLLDDCELTAEQIYAKAMENVTA